MNKYEQKFYEAKANNDTYLAENNIYINPFENANIKALTGKGIDSGKAGKTFEIACKLLANTTKGALVSKSGRVDSIKTINGKRIVIEYKTGAGAIKAIDEEIDEEIFNNPTELVDYLNWNKDNSVMIYTPEYNEKISLDTYLKIAYVIPTKALYDFCKTEKKKLIRVSKSRPNVIRWCSDFKDYFFNILEKYNCLTFGEWLEIANN